MSKNSDEPPDPPADAKAPETISVEIVAPDTLHGLDQINWYQPDAVIPLGDGSPSTLIFNHSVEMTEGITPELAAHRLELEAGRNVTALQIAECNAASAERVAELTYLAPVKEQAKPFYLVTGVLSLGAAASLYLHQYTLAGICFGGISVPGVVKAIKDGIAGKKSG